MNRDQKVTESAEYISNPFVLAYRASQKLFNTNRGWAIFLIITGIFSTLSQGSDLSGRQPAQSAGTSTPPVSIELVVFVASFVALFVIIVFVLSIYLSGILSYVTLQSEKSKKVGVREAIDATSKRFWRLCGSLALALVKILGWSLLFIIPGIIAALRYSLLSYVIMDEPAEKSVKESHERIKTLTKGRLLEVFGMGFTSIVPFVGALFNTAGNAALYRQLQISTDKNIEKPKIHWLNYFLLLILLLITIVAGVVVTTNVIFGNYDL